MTAEFFGGYPTFADYCATIGNGDLGLCQEYNNRKEEEDEQTSHLELKMRGCRLEKSIKWKLFSGKGESKYDRGARKLNVGGHT